MCEGCVRDGFISRWLYEVIEAFIEAYPESPYSIGHIVLDDCNVENGHIEWCLAEAPATRNDAGVESFLRWMLTVPESSRMGVHAQGE